MWRLLGVDARLRRAGPSFGPPATLITLLGLLTFGAACAYAVSQDAAEESVSSDPGQSAYTAGRFIDALRIWRPRAEQGESRADQRNDQHQAAEAHQQSRLRNRSIAPCHSGKFDGARG